MCWIDISLAFGIGLLVGAWIEGAWTEYFASTVKLECSRCGRRIFLNINPALGGEPPKNQKSLCIQCEWIDNMRGLT
jgi:hypothetical protein